MHKASQNKPPKRRRVTLQQMRDRTDRWIRENGGRLVDGLVTSAKSKILVRCDYGHEFKTSYDNLKSGKWCRRCGYLSSAEKRFGYTIRELQQIAADRGGEFRSSTYSGVKSKYEWYCPTHGSFWATADNVANSNAWCPGCWEDRRGGVKRAPVEKLIEVVKHRGGRLVSATGDYAGLKNTQVRIQCANGHEWETTAASIVTAGSWCPECQGTAGELVTRRIFEATYGEPFPKCRPAFLKTSRGGRLELDGFCESLRIAFEYQGPRHDSADQQARDQEKQKACAERGIRLVAIPYVKNPYPIEDVFRVVQEEIHKYDPDQEVRLPQGDLFPNELKALQDYARARGGELLTDQYLGSKAKHEWTCADPSHPVWTATPEQIKSKQTWCPHCAGIHRRDLDWLRAFACEHQLECLADEYHGSDFPYRWKCSKGHQFDCRKGNMLQRIRRGQNACVICAGSRAPVTMNDLWRLANSRGGECLSDKYTDAHSELTWRCQKGHMFARNWNKVQQGYWCTEPGCPESRNWGRFDRFSC